MCFTEESDEVYCVMLRVNRDKMRVDYGIK